MLWKVWHVDKGRQRGQWKVDTRPPGASPVHLAPFPVHQAGWARAMGHALVLAGATRIHKRLTDTFLDNDKTNNNFNKQA